MPKKNEYSYWWDFGPNYKTIRVCSDDPDFWIVKEFKIVNDNSEYMSVKNSELLIDKAQKMIYDLKCGRISHKTLKKIKNNN
jgi:hypothetical protein